MYCVGVLLQCVLCIDVLNGMCVCQTLLVFDLLFYWFGLTHISYRVMYSEALLLCVVLYCCRLCCRDVVGAGVAFVFVVHLLFLLLFVLFIVCLYSSSSCAAFIVPRVLVSVVVIVVLGFVAVFLLHPMPMLSGVVSSVVFVVAAVVCCCVLVHAALNVLFVFIVLSLLLSFRCWCCIPNL